MFPHLVPAPVAGHTKGAYIPAPPLPSDWGQEVTGLAALPAALSQLQGQVLQQGIRSGQVG